MGSRPPRSATGPRSGEDGGGSWVLWGVQRGSFCGARGWAGPRQRLGRGTSTPAALSPSPGRFLWWRGGLYLKPISLSVVLEFCVSTRGLLRQRCGPAPASLPSSPPALLLQPDSHVQNQARAKGADVSELASGPVQMFLLQIS